MCSLTAPEPVTGEFVIFVDAKTDPREILRMNLDTLEVTTITSGTKANAISYDSVEQRVYWIEDYINITRCYLDGSEQEVVFSGNTGKRYKPCVPEKAGPKNI